MPEFCTKLYDLSNGKSITSLTSFSSPVDEYHAAFEDRAQPFLNYYTFRDGESKKRNLARGEFWALACSAAIYLSSQGLSKGDRIVVCLT